MRERSLIWKKQRAEKVNAGDQHFICCVGPSLYKLPWATKSGNKLGNKVKMAHSGVTPRHPTRRIRSQ